MSITKRVVWVVMLIGVGWTFGAAQRPDPEFMIAIDAPAGETRVECISGCSLMGARDLPNARASRMKVYSYGCSGRDAQRCGARVAGWRSQ